MDAITYPQRVLWLPEEEFFIPCVSLLRGNEGAEESGAAISISVL